MRNQTAFFVIISISFLILNLLIVYAVYNGTTNKRINQLIQEVTTLKSQATQAAELANSTQSDLRATIASQEGSFTSTIQSLNATSTAYANDIQSDLRATIAFQEVSFPPTIQSLNADIDKIAQTATSTAHEEAAMAEKFKQLSATATSIAPQSIEVKYKETGTVSLFGDQLSIEFAGYGFWSSVVKIIVQSPNSVSQTFYIDPGEVVLYKNYIILRGDSGEKQDEQGVVIVQFVVTGY